MTTFLLDSLFQPTLTALSPKISLPLSLRIRLLILQPSLLLLTLLILISNPRPTYTTIHIPTRSTHTLRALVFHPKPKPPKTSITDPERNCKRKPPLHISLHAGAFLAGLPDLNIRLCTHLAATTGAVIVAPSYRLSPRHVFPAAYHDVLDALAALPRLTDTAPDLVTVDGFSAGGHLALAASAAVDAPRRPKACVAFYPPLDLVEMPWGGEWVMWALGRVLAPLVQAYAAPGLGHQGFDAGVGLRPGRACAEVLPWDLMVVVAGADVLAGEQVAFVERVRREVEDRGEERRVEVLVGEGRMHGWLEVPGFLVGRKGREERKEIFGRVVEFIKETHRKRGWVWEG